MPLRLAILASYNVDLLARALPEPLARRGLEAQIHVSPFGQYRQEILADDSALYRSDPSHVLLVADFGDLFADLVRHPFRADRAAGRARADEEVAEMRSLVDRLHERVPDASIAVATLIAPPRSALRLLDRNSPYSLRGVAEIFNDGLEELATTRPWVDVLDHASLIAWHGYRESYDERLWVIGRMRLGLEATMSLAEEWAALVRATVRAPRKCLVLDLDGTLWGGLAGEGSGEVELGNEGLGLAYRQFQEELLNLRERGVLLALASKNNPDDALRIIDAHPAMVLQRSHFAALRINWHDKATNLREIAAELDIGLDSIVFIDDDPVERDWVTTQLPQVHVVSLGDDPALFRRALLELDDFATLSLTAEDRIRPELYERRARAEEFRRTAPSLDDFYAGLAMRVEIVEPEGPRVARVGQLVRKTNQLNLTSRRYDDVQIGLFLRSPDHRVYALSLQDRFGDHGTVGAAIVVRERDAWRIDTLVLSCRVLGRTIEQAFLAFLAAGARANGAARLVGEFVPTAKNEPARDVYRSAGFSPIDADGRLWTFDLGDELALPAYFQLLGTARERSVA